MLSKNNNRDRLIAGWLCRWRLILVVCCVCVFTSVGLFSFSSAANLLRWPVPSRHILNGNDPYEPSCQRRAWDDDDSSFSEFAPDLLMSNESMILEHSFSSWVSHGYVGRYHTYSIFGNACVCLYSILLEDALISYQVSGLGGKRCHALLFIFYPLYHTR
jgi:hypothetical protein